MSKRLLLVLSAAIAALTVSGCLFGDPDETATQTVTGKDKNPKDTAAKMRFIVPGVYSGDYAWIDSNKHGLESEFQLDQKGKYRLFWISENEAVYDQHGEWNQKDANFFFSGTSEAWVSSGVFADFTSMEDDTNAVSNVTDTTFTRREYTPLRQKPYWITYHKRNYPVLAKGDYHLIKTYGEDSTKVTYHFKITLADSFNFSVTEDTLESFQAKAAYYQVGSFLVTEGNAQREIDSTKTFPNSWSPIPGAILKRLQSVSDTAFNMWSPPSFFEPGSWDIYDKKLK